MLHAEERREIYGRKDTSPCPEVGTGHSTYRSQVIGRFPVPAFPNVVDDPGVSALVYSLDNPSGSVALSCPPSSTSYDPPLELAKPRLPVDIWLPNVIKDGSPKRPARDRADCGVSTMAPALAATRRGAGVRPSNAETLRDRVRPRSLYEERRTKGDDSGRATILPGGTGRGRGDKAAIVASASRVTVLQVGGALLDSCTADVPVMVEGGQTSSMHAQAGYVREDRPCCDPWGLLAERPSCFPSRILRGRLVMQDSHPSHVS
ncbi:hypothetical protein LXA43DRAFT_274667 [Ganoderma leucocontextum]|nr:hypothetical protein LXA43DRAFT_274667 [Ganoderma leucocontextum]